MSATDPLAWIDDELDRLVRAQLCRQLAVRTSPQAACLVLDGTQLINFGSNDYLGLANDVRLCTAARATIDGGGWGSGASPLVSGRSEVHAELESRLAEFEGTEAALVFPSGFAANAGTIPALVDADDAIFGDAKNHASLIDGCRLSRAQRFVYPHADCDALERLLQTATGFRRRLIVSDTLFSMDGDLAPLERLAELAERYDAMLMVDEAHATGVFGANGRGVAEHLLLNSLHDRVHIRVGTLSKALGCAGGFVCGRRPLIDWLANKARSYVFSTAQPAANCAAALAALEIVRSEPHRREQLLDRAAELRMRLSAQGWNLGASGEERGARGEEQSVESIGRSGSLISAPYSQLHSQIIPLVVGDAARTMRLAAELRDAGFFVPGIRPPSVPEGESLLRISLCYHHTPATIDALVEQLGRLIASDM